jgi:hypothetical protein
MVIDDLLALPEKDLPISGFGINFLPFWDLFCTDNDLLGSKSLRGYKWYSDGTIINFAKCNGVVIRVHDKYPKRPIPTICDGNLTIGKFISSCFRNSPHSAQCLDRFHFIALCERRKHYEKSDLDFDHLEKLLLGITISAKNLTKYQQYEYLQDMESRPPWLR